MWFSNFLEKASESRVNRRMLKGGLQVSQGSVSTILRRSDTGDGPVTRVGRSLWGLAEWYLGHHAATKVLYVVESQNRSLS